jgi:hypothetical protein
MSFNNEDNARTLDSVLDKIDSSLRPMKKQRVEVTSESGMPSSLVSGSRADGEESAKCQNITTAGYQRIPVSDNSSSINPTLSVSTAVSNNPIWLEYIDPASGKSYYFNTHTKETTWDRPLHFSPAPSLSNTLKRGDEYKVVGTFNSQSGRFTTLKSHLHTETGQNIDRSLRQLGHYMDINELERNREEAKLKKQTASQPPQGGNWREFNKEKKEEKKKKKLDSLLNGA